MKINRNHADFFVFMKDLESAEDYLRRRRQVAEADAVKLAYRLMIEYSDAVKDEEKRKLNHIREVAVDVEEEDLKYV